jgi:hypothetical protein
MREETKEVLHLFIEKVDRLLSLSFTRHMLQVADTSQRILFTGEGAEVFDFGPGDEAIDAFVLTFRFFIQDNERTSLRSLLNLLQDDQLSEWWKQEYTRIRSEVNTYLNTNPIHFGPREISRRDVLEVFVYGGFAHANREKRRIFNEWKEDDVMFGLRKNDFVVTLSQVLKCISELSSICEQELRSN